MNKDEFNNKGDCLSIFGTCGTDYYFFLNDNKEIEISCKYCELTGSPTPKTIEIKRFIKIANDLKKVLKNE